jgi:hypothetical protein
LKAASPALARPGRRGYAARMSNAIREGLRALEPLFHRPEHGTTRADFERMTEASFFETGASGRRYSREFVLVELEKRHASGAIRDEWSVDDDFLCSELSHDVYLVTYTLRQGERVTRRATIWRRSADGWKAVYHQGTIVAND